MDKKAIQNFLNNIFVTWLQPELLRRQKESNLPPNFSIKKAQVIFLLDGQQHIRFNDEVKAYILTNKGEASESQNFDEEDISVKRLDLTDEEQDFAHITLLRVRELWVIAFDFRHRVTDSKRFFELGAEYLKAAELCYKSKKHKSATANLYIAALNLLKARIFLYPDPKVRKVKWHKEMASIIQIHAKDTQIIKDPYNKAFNFLYEVFTRARFDPVWKIQARDLSRLIKTIFNLKWEIRKFYKQNVIYKD